MTNIVSAFSNSSFQWYLIGFFNSSEFFSFRATCKTFTKVGSDDKDLSHKGIAFTDYISSVKHLDIYVAGKYHSRQDIREATNNLNDPNSFRDCELRRIKFVKSTTYHLKELSFVMDSSPMAKIYQEDFLRYAHHAIFANLEVFHYALPLQKKIGTIPHSGRRTAAILEPFYITQNDIRELAKRCQNIHTLYVLLRRDDPADLNNFLRPIDLKTEGDSKVYAETCFPNLTCITLDCREKSFSKELISILNELPALKTVKVDSNIGHSQHFFDIFSNITKFTEFCTDRFNVDNLSKLTSLQKLGITGCDTYNLEDFEKIFSLPSLTSLKIGNFGLHLRNITTAQFMEVLYRKGTQIKELIITHWRGLENFKNAFPICANMKNLKKISIITSTLDDQELSDLSLCNIQELQISNLENWMRRASDKGLLALKSKNLQKLTLGKNPFSNQAILEMISGCPNLTSLDISDLSQQIKDVVIKAFGSKINIETLNPTTSF